MNDSAVMSRPISGFQYTILIIICAYHLHTACIISILKLTFQLMKTTRKYRLTSFSSSLCFATCDSNTCFKALPRKYNKNTIDLKFRRHQYTKQSTQDVLIFDKSYKVMQ